jgi:predicted ArsR family transcriptional regulator
LNQQLIAEIGRTQRLQILNALKRSKGMSVNELVAKMGMSYMGIKQHCLTLERDGYLDTWRRPQKMGRPEMVYRLTKRTHDLFPCDSNDFTLEVLKSVSEIYGPSAAEKLLYNVFERKASEMKSKIQGTSVAERARAFAELREKEGFMSDFIEHAKEGSPHILECHSPILNLIDRFPIIQKLEQDLVSNVLRTRVRREESRVSGLYECIFYFDSEPAMTQADGVAAHDTRAHDGSAS